MANPTASTTRHYLPPGMLLSFKAKDGMPSVCSYLGVSRQHVYDLIKSGDFPPVIRISTNRIGVRVGDLDEWISKRIERPTASELQHTITDRLQIGKRLQEAGITLDLDQLAAVFMAVEDPAVAQAIQIITR